MRRLHLLVLSALFIFVYHSIIPIRAATPNGDDCGFYLDLEKELGCWPKLKDSSDYLVLYGYKYCSAFHRKAEVWNDERTAWIKRTTLCLQKSLADEKAPADCVKLEKKAFEQHSVCYTQSGFCKLGILQKASVVSTAIGLEFLWKLKKSSAQAFRVAANCLDDDTALLLDLRDRLAPAVWDNDLDAAKIAGVFDVEGLDQSRLSEYLHYASNEIANKVSRGGSRRNSFAGSELSSNSTDENALNRVLEFKEELKTK